MQLAFMWFMIPLAITIVAMVIVRYRREGKWSQTWLAFMIVLLTINQSLRALAHGRFETLELAISCAVIVIAVVVIYQNTIAKGQR